jgi:undecaprenyl-diphosphatase
MKKQSLLILSLIFLAAFSLVIFGINYGLFSSIDLLVNNYFSTLHNVFLTNLSIVLSWMFDTITLVIVSLIISAILIKNNKRKPAIFFSFVMLVSGILIYVLKELVMRVRPENIYETNFSFPSGHSVIIIVFIGLLFMIFKKLKLNVLDILLMSFAIFVVTFSRLYLGVHWFSDVIGGFVLGFSILFMAWFLRANTLSH